MNVIYDALLKIKNDTRKLFYQFYSIRKNEDEKIFLEKTRRDDDIDCHTKRLRCEKQVNKFIYM